MKILRNAKLTQEELDNFISSVLCQLNYSLPPDLFNKVYKDIEIPEALLNYRIEKEGVNFTLIQYLLFHLLAFDIDDENDNVSVNIASLFRFLNDNGFNIDELDENKWSALHSAAKIKNLPFIKALLAAGADPNLEDDVGLSVLHYALMHEYANPHMNHGDLIPIGDHFTWVEHELPTDTSLRHTIAKTLINAGANITDEIKFWFEHDTVLKSILNKENKMSRSRNNEPLIKAGAVIEAGSRYTINQSTKPIVITANNAEDTIKQLQQIKITPSKTSIFKQSTDGSSITITMNDDATNNTVVNKFRK